MLLPRSAFIQRHHCKASYLWRAVPSFIHRKGGAVTARTFTTRESKFITSSALGTAPDSRRGILTQWQRQRAKFFCTVCQTMQSVQSVDGIIQAPDHATYTNCVLECGHSRDIGVSVQRTASITKAMEEKERVELLDQMKSAGTL